jgi:signal recognition particle GTPase
MKCVREQDLEELRRFGHVAGWMRKNRRKGVDFTYNDYLQQIKNLKEIGGIQKVVTAFQGDALISL